MKLNNFNILQYLFFFWNSNNIKQCRLFYLDYNFFPLRLFLIFVIQSLIAASVVQGQPAGLQYPSSRVQTRPEPSDFKGEKILSMPSFRGEVKPSVPCRRFEACIRSLKFTWKSEFRQNYLTSFSPTVPPFAARISRVVADIQAPGGESGNV